MDENGFSLIELLFVIGLIGLLTTLAYPNYTQYLTHARRIDGQTALLDLATQLEQHHAQAHTYQTAILNNPISAGQWYTLSIAHATQTTYRLKATPNKQQATQDTTCQTLILDSTGQTGIEPGPRGKPTGTAQVCW